MSLFHVLNTLNNIINIQREKKKKNRENPFFFGSETGVAPQHYELHPQSKRRRIENYVGKPSRRLSKLLRGTTHRPDRSFSRLSSSCSSALPELLRARRALSRFPLGARYPPRILTCRGALPGPVSLAWACVSKRAHISTRC